jgi:hypothetical protein
MVVHDVTSISELLDERTDHLLGGVGGALVHDVKVELEVVARRDALDCLTDEVRAIARADDDRNLGGHGDGSILRGGRRS